MAIDTAAKRCSAATVGPPTTGKPILPGGGVTAADRQDVNWLYRGILATGPTLTGYIPYLRRIIWWLFAKKRHKREPWKS